MELNQLISELVIWANQTVQNSSYFLAAETSKKCFRWYAIRNAVLQRTYSTLHYTPKNNSLSVRSNSTVNINAMRQDKWKWSRTTTRVCKHLLSVSRRRSKLYRAHSMYREFRSQTFHPPTGNKVKCINKNSLLFTNPWNIYASVQRL